MVENASVGPGIEGSTEESTANGRPSRSVSHSAFGAARIGNDPLENRIIQKQNTVPNIRPLRNRSRAARLPSRLLRNDEVELERHDIIAIANAKLDGR